MHVEVVRDALQITLDKRANGQVLVDFLDQRLKLPAGFIRELLHAGRARIGNHAAGPSQVLAAGQRLWLQGGVEEVDPLAVCLRPVNAPRPANVPPSPQPRPANVPPSPQPRPADALRPSDTPPAAHFLDILYEDPHMLVVNKPSGVLVHPGDESDVDTMAHRVVAYFAEAGLARRARHVHRLDRDTTGALLYVKHEFAARSFDRLLQGHEIARRYVALVAGEMPRLRGTIREPIGRDRHVSGRYRVSRTGKLAVTHYRVLASTRIGADAVSLVECVLETGRTHQIRVHLSAAGCPVVGDVLYGGGRGIGGIPFPEGYALHAWQLTLWHPYTEQEVCVQAPFPRLFVDVVRQLSMEVSLDALQVEAR